MFSPRDYVDVGPGLLVKSFMSAKAKVLALDDKKFVKVI